MEGYLLKQELNSILLQKNVHDTIELFPPLFFGGGGQKPLKIRLSTYLGNFNKFTHKYSA